MTKDEFIKNIPDFVQVVASGLVKSGFEAYLVGGAVRDILLSRPVKDFDIATNALPEQIVKIFPKSVSTNAKFGTILVISEDKNSERHDVEVTTYRLEEEYFGGRWPAVVEFTKSIEEDLSRRDFTINAIALNLDKTSNDYLNLIDPFHGKVDLKDGIIRAVNNPIERFSEDGLRAFKACRLASELGFEIEAKTFNAITKTLHIAEQISAERIRDELLKLLKYSPKPSIGIELLRKTGLLKLFMPELLETIGVVQPEWHTDDVYLHSLKTLDIAEDSIKLAALLHDIGKARTISHDAKGTHFYGHDVAGAQMAEAVMKRLRFSKQAIERTTNLIKHHMFYYPSADWRKQNHIKDIDTQGGWTDSAIRRFIKTVGEENIEDLFKLRIADAASNPKSSFTSVEIEALEKRIAEVRAKEMVIKLADLDINGYDLKKLGITAGPTIGKILNELLEMVIEEPFINDKKKLLEIVKKLKIRYENE